MIGVVASGSGEFCYGEKASLAEVVAVAGDWLGPPPWPITTVDAVEIIFLESAGGGVETAAARSRRLWGTSCQGTTAMISLADSRIRVLAESPGGILKLPM